MIAGIIQARMGSSRLPGKVMMKINDRTILEHCLIRLSNSKKVDKWIVATTTNAEDNIIADFCETNQIACYRGSQNDVLDRFYRAQIELAPSAETIVRICCDNPTHDGTVVDYCIQEFNKLGVDYFSNGNEPPHYSQDGITAEVFTTIAMHQAWNKSTLLSEREHVTPFIKKSSYFKKAWRKYTDEFSFKLSVDNEADFKLNQAIFEGLGNNFTIPQLIQFLKSNPEIRSINASSIINEGYLKSLKEDKHIGK
jgi:spore coat polysaccharide biosynthesis protein SpsF